MRAEFIFTLLLHFPLSIWCQSDSLIKKDNDEKRHFVAAQILGGSMFSAHYEFQFIRQKWFRVNSEVGIGRAEYGDDAHDPISPFTRAIHFGFTPQFAEKRFSLLTSAHPILYMRGNFSFINLSGFFGLRFQPLNEPVYFSIQYTPKLYSSRINDEIIYTHFPVGLRIGANL